MADTGEHLHVSPLLILVPRDRRGSRRLEVDRPSAVSAWDKRGLLGQCGPGMGLAF